MPTPDVLIVVGGPAGSTCARALVDVDADVLLLDRADDASPRTVQPFHGFRPRGRVDYRNIFRRLPA